MKQEGVESRFLVCDACHASGSIVQGGKAQPCGTCDGAGMVVFDGDRFVYWGKTLSAATITRSRLFRMGSMLIRGLLIGFGVLGLTFFLLELIVLVPSGITFEKILTIRSPAMLIFSLSLATDMVIVYLFDLAFSRQAIQTNTQKKARVPDTARIPLSGIFSLDASLRLDLSRVINDDAMEVIENAWYLAKQWGHEEVTPLHVFGTLLDTQDVRIILLRMGLARRDVYTRLRTLFTGRFTRKRDVNPLLGREARSLLFAAYARALAANERRVGSADLLAALGTSGGLVQNVLDDLDLTPDKIKNVTAWVTAWRSFIESARMFRAKAAAKPKGIMDRAMTARETPLLDRFSTDLTLTARSGNVLPLVNRHAEMEEILRVLAEPGRNILLVGEVGVGKFSLIHGLARRMVEEAVPLSLQDKRLVYLDVDALLSLPSNGRVESRLLSMIYEAVASGNIVLAIRDIGHLVGAGETGSVTADASLVLAQALSSNGIRVIATATTQDFVGHFQDNPTFLRHFHVLHCEEVSVNTAIQIVQMHALMIEAKENVFFTYDAIAAMVQLSHQYIHDEVLPEKAIQLARDVASVVRNRRGKGEIVTKDDVAGVLSERTRIPVTETGRDEANLLLNMEAKIHERIVGQDEAVEVVANALRRARTKLRDERRPIANFLFLGPTGVGKTELAKTVANVYFGSDDTMVRLDMSEYEEPSSLERLIGTPTLKGQLTEKVRNAPFSLILLDELEKAHADVLNVFLEVMDDGRLTDGMGRVIDFTSAILIATSNAGSSFIQEELRAGASVEQIQESLLREHLPQIFRPEFLNRFDAIVVFKPLSFEEVVLITKQEIRRVAARLEAKGIRLIASDDAVRELAMKGFDPTLGARPIRRLVQDHIDNTLAKFLLRGSIGRRDIVVLEQGGKLAIERAEPLA